MKMTIEEFLDESLDICEIVSFIERTVDSEKLRMMLGALELQSLIVNKVLVKEFEDIAIPIRSDLIHETLIHMVLEKLEDKSFL